MHLPPSLPPSERRMPAHPIPDACPSLLSSKNQNRIHPYVPRYLSRVPPEPRHSGKPLSPPPRAPHARFYNSHMTNDVEYVKSTRLFFCVGSTVE